jgi:diguanylate cyclase (GGDEF)-like protein
LHDADDLESLGSDIVYSLHVDASGTLWVGTRGGGLNKVTGTPDEPSSVTFTGYLDREGLPDNDVYGIRSDAEGDLWLSTNRGLSRFDPRSETFTNYNVSHGLQADEFHFGSHFSSTSGELFFGGVNGFNSFFPERLIGNGHVPPVKLTGFLKLNEPVGVAALSGVGEPIDLGYKDDVVTFEFAALDYAAPEQNRYAYMLEGFDADWVDVGDIRRVTYTDLDGGDYVFRVKAANNDGVWNEAGLTVPVRVATPPWKTAWAYAFYLLAALSAAWIFVRAQRSKLRREEQYSQRLEQEVEARTEELAERASELEELNEKLVQASLTDSLTGMANRRFLFDWVDKEVAQLQRQYDELAKGTLAPETFDLVFLMIDLDDFKRINDTCGHMAGDEVLMEVKSILDETCRRPDLMIRWGGDEFLVVARGSTPEGVTSLAERIRSEIENHPFVLPEGQVVHTTCSIGIACYPFQRTDLEALSWDQVINVADVALYTAKRSGRNAWVGLFSTDSTEAKGLLRVIRESPGDLVEAGAIEVRTSITDEESLLWQPFRSRASTAPLEFPGKGEQEVRQ